MLWGDTSRVGRPFSKDPAVVRFGGHYLLYYSLPPFAPELAPPDAPAGWNIGIAESHDLESWTKVGEIHPAAACEAKGLTAPGAVVLRGQVHLFYQTYGNGAKDAICHAVSGDGIHFERNPSNPIFAPTGEWNNGRAIDADVIPWQGKLFLFFSTRDPAGRIQMGGVATAPLDSDFSRATWTQQGDGPTIRPELPWEQECIEASALCAHDRKLFVFYGGAYNNCPQQIGCAVSADGIRWRRLSDQPFLPNGEPCEWNASESGHPFVFTDEDGRTYLFFQGNNDRGKSWYLSRKEILWKEGLPYPG